MQRTSKGSASPTSSSARPHAREVTAKEFHHGKGLLLEKIATNEPRVLIFSFKKAAQALFGFFEGNGIIKGLESEGTIIFVMPGPYAKREEVADKLKELCQLLGTEPPAC